MTTDTFVCVLRIIDSLQALVLLVDAVRTECGWHQLVRPIDSAHLDVHLPVIVQCI